MPHLLSVSTSGLPLHRVLDDEYLPTVCAGYCDLAAGLEAGKTKQGKADQDQVDKSIISNQVKSSQVGSDQARKAVLVVLLHNTSPPYASPRLAFASSFLTRPRTGFGICFRLSSLFSLFSLFPLPAYLPYLNFTLLAYLFGFGSGFGFGFLARVYSIRHFTSHSLTYMVDTDIGAKA